MSEPGIRIVFYTRQPFVAAGLSSVLSARQRFRLLACCDNLASTMNSLRARRPDILLVQLTPRFSLDELLRLHSAAPESRIVLWGEAPGGDFAFQSMQLGVRAILPDDTPVRDFLANLVSVHSGVLCFEKAFVDKVMLQPRIRLTTREGQVVSLVAQGLKNKAIGARLGITEGTVKVYIYKLFRKLGVGDRLGMALYGLEHLCGGATQDRGDVFVPQSLPAQESHRIN